MFSINSFIDKRNLPNWIFLPFSHDDIMVWRRFRQCRPFVRRIYRIYQLPVDSTVERSIAWNFPIVQLEFDISCFVCFNRLDCILFINSHLIAVIRSLRLTGALFTQNEISCNCNHQRHIHLRNDVCSMIVISCFAQRIEYNIIPKRGIHAWHLNLYVYIYVNIISTFAYLMCYKQVRKHTFKVPYLHWYWQGAMSQHTLSSN